MLDIKFVRENPDAVKENIKKKFQDAKLPLVDEVIEKDAKYRDHGVICWHRDGTCLRTDMEKIERRKKNDSSCF